jgi:Predicted hydrolases of HD superfamily
MTDYVTDNPRFAGSVLRYHTWPTIQRQTVGEHCWQIALIHEQIFGTLEHDVERFIRHHDTAELRVGDPPFPVKSQNGDMKAAYDRIEPKALQDMGINPLPELIDRDRIRIKVCDLLEMMCFGMIEVEMGNALGVPIVIRTERAATKLSHTELSATDDVCVQNFIYEAWARHENVLKLKDPMIYNYEERNKLL